MSNEPHTTMNGGDELDEEEDIEKLQEEIRKMEEEAARISKQTEELKQSSATADASNNNNNINNNTNNNTNNDNEQTDKTKQDGFSVYVGQVEYSAKPEELLAHFQPCGVVERVTIVCDKMTGHSKGYAYIEFQTEESMHNAVKLNGSTFKDRELKVMRKRVNEPAFQRGGGRGGRGRGGRGRGRGGRGRFRGGRAGFYGGRGGYRGGGGGYGGGGRGGGHYHQPY